MIKNGTTIKVIDRRFNVRQGVIVHTFPANIKPEKELVEKYYGPNHVKYKFILNACEYDRVVVEYAQGKYFIFPNNPMFFNYTILKG